MKHSVTFFILLLGAFSLCAQQPTWQALERPWGTAPSDALINNLGHIFVLDAEGLARSVDGGQTWQALGTSIEDFSATLDLAQMPDGTVFAAGTRNMYVVRPGSDVVEIVSLPDEPFSFTTNPRGDLFLVEAFRTVYRSTDGGRSFTKFVAPNKTQGWPRAMYFFGNDQNFLVSSYGTTEYLWRISDDGTKVDRIALPGSPTGPSMLRHPSGKFFLWASSGSYSSTDGKTWSKFKIIPGSSYESIRLMFCDPVGKLYADAQGAWYESSDEGKTWTKSAFVGRWVNFVRYAQDGSIAVKGAACNDGKALLLSRDNWATSELLDTRMKRSDVSSILKDGKGRLYVRTCANTLVSEDDGKSWSRYTINNASIDQLVFTKSGRGFALVSVDTAWYISYDKGDTWQRNPNMPVFQNITQNGIKSIKEGPDGNLYGLGSSQIFKSTDFGESWSPIKSTPWLPSGELWIHPNGDFYIEDYFIYKSSDGGQTWNKMDVLGGDILDVLSFYMTNQGLILLRLYKDSDASYITYISTDGGLTFQVLPPPSSNSGLFYGFYSNDAGDVFGVNSNGLFISKDRCKTWTLLSGSLPFYYINAFYCDVQNHLYLSFYKETIYKSQQPVSYPNLIRGRVFVDDNTNCLPDAGETGQPFQLLKAQGGITRLSAAGLDGSFTLDVPDGQYKVSAVPPSPLWQACPPVTVNLATGQADSARVEVGLKTLARCADLNVGISTPFLRRCFSNTYYIYVANNGNAPASNVEAVLTLDSLMVYESASLPPNSQQGKVLTFRVGDLAAGAFQSFQVQVKVDCDADFGQMHCVSVELTPQPNCSVVLPAHHTARECRPNQGAYDPNDKQAFANGLPLTGKVPPNAELEYLVRFQNTGTDTAFTVVVSDRLSPKLDLQSVRPGVSSHPYRYEIREDRTLRFIFDNIALPDSNTNEPASHGFVKFSVKPIATVPLGDKIANVADIYFDFNAPVRTNTVNLTVELPTATREPAPALRCLVSPNPARDAFTVQWERNGRAWSGNLQLELFDATGRAALRQTVSGTQTTISRGELPSGLYWLKATATDGSFARAKVVLE